MKKKLSLVIAIMMLMFVVVGCAADATGQDSTAVSGAASGVASGAPVEGGVLRVGMDLKFPPFSYIDDSGAPAGFEPMIAAAFAEYLGMEVEIVDTDFSLLIPALQTGDVDILIADMSYTEEREQNADFSDPYRYTQSLALVNRAYAEANNITDDMPVEEFFALTGQDFIGLAGTFGVMVPQQYGAEVEEVTEIGIGILEVANGQATSLVASNEIHQFHAQNPDTTIVYSGIGNWSGSCFVVKTGNAELLASSNEFIASMYAEGGFYDQIREEYDAVIAEFLQNDEYGLDYIIQQPEGWME